MKNNMKDKILEAFYELVIEDGIENSALSKVAKKIGINTSLIFHYYENKEDLVSHFFDYVLARSRDVFCFEDLSSEDIATAFETYINRIINLQYSKTDSKAYYTCYVLALRKDEYNKRFLEHKKTLLNILIDTIEYFKSKDVIHPKNVVNTANYLEIITEGIANMRDFQVLDHDAETSIYLKELLIHAMNS